MKNLIFIGILVVALAVLGLGYWEAQAQLQDTQNKLADVQKELKTAQTELRDTQDKLTSTQNELTSTRAGLRETQNRLVNTKDELSRTKADLEKRRDELLRTRDELATAQAKLRELENRINELKEYADKRYQEGLEAGLGHGYTIKDPTYQEMKDFIAKDQTDKNEYIKDKYVCSHFARDVCNNSEKRGIRCAFVEIRFKEGGHAIVAFNTIDKGLVYIEPQTDKEMKPEIGKPYWPRDRYQPPTYDDTVVDILVIW